MSETVPVGHVITVKQIGTWGECAVNCSCGWTGKTDYRQNAELEGAQHVARSMYYIAVDGLENLTLWRGSPEDPRPMPVLTEYQLRKAPEVWAALVEFYGPVRQ